MPFEQTNQALQHDRHQAWGEAPFDIAVAVSTIGMKKTIGFKELTLSLFPSPPDNLSGQEAALSDNPKPKNRFFRVIVGVVVFAMSLLPKAIARGYHAPTKLTSTPVCWLFGFSWAMRVSVRPSVAVRACTLSTG